MSYDIVTFGPLIVEIIRKEMDVEFGRPSEFVGPFPSGDTPIMINAAAKLGAKTAIIGAVGGDEFGECVYDRLKDSGVDLSYVQRNNKKYTGSTFVSYCSDGSRNFLYHLEGSGSIEFDYNSITKDVFSKCKWVHYTGFTLESGESYRKAVYRSLELIDENTKVSFDPNIRPEIFSPDEIRDMCQPIIERADLILPSGTEAMLFTGAQTEEDGCKLLTENGTKLVVLKRGDKGSRFFLADEIIDVPSYQAEEIDPTGAGDTYAAALIVAFIEGKSIYEAGRFANAAGAYAVTKKGPMEGAPSRQALDSFLRSGEKVVPMQ